MAHGNKTMPLDRYPFMDNDLKTSGGGGGVTPEEFNALKEMVVQNTSDISDLSGQVGTNTEDITTLENSTVYNMVNTTSDTIPEGLSIEDYAETLPNHTFQVIYTHVSDIARLGLPISNSPANIIIFKAPTNGITTIYIYPCANTASFFKSRLNNGEWSEWIEYFRKTAHDIKVKDISDRIATISGRYLHCNDIVQVYFQITLNDDFTDGGYLNLGNLDTTLEEFPQVLPKFYCALNGVRVIGGISQTGKVEIRNVGGSTLTAGSTIGFGGVYYG